MCFYSCNLAGETLRTDLAAFHYHLLPFTAIDDDDYNAAAAAVASANDDDDGDDDDDDDGDNDNKDDRLGLVWLGIVFITIYIFFLISYILEYFYILISRI